MTQGAAIKYTEAELAWIKDSCKSPRAQAHQVFCAIFKRSDISLENYKALCTRKGWNTGRNGCFESGNNPHNKGGKMAYHPNSAATRFKKGQTPHNTNYIGHERVTKDGYIEISVAEINPYTGADRCYVLKHGYLWERENGKLSEGMCLKCLDGNRQNTTPSNWEAIPRGALPFLNGHRGHNYEQVSAALRPVVLTLAKLKYAKSKARKSVNPTPSFNLGE